jgi:hypothetical protein
VVRPIRLRQWLIGYLQTHPVLAFVTMGVCFIGFSLSSYNLIVILRANLDLLAEYGWTAAADGGLRQLFELVGLSYLSLACYLGFKCCEKLLVDRLTKNKE